MSNLYGIDFDNSPSKEFDMEKCCCIILGEKMPFKYLQELKKNDEEYGITSVPDWRKSGYAIDFAIIRRSNNIGEVINKIVNIDSDKGTVDTPEYVFWGQIQSLPPDQLFTKKNDKQRRIGMEEAREGIPIIKAVLPSAYPCKINFGDSYDASKIPEHLEGKPATIKLRQQEQERVTHWAKVMNKFAEVTNDEALAFYRTEVARRLLLVSGIEDGKVIYTEPKKGMLFMAGIDGGKWLNCYGFKTLKIGNKYETKIYSDLQVMDPSAQTIELADKLHWIIKTLQERKKEEEDGVTFKVDEFDDVSEPEDDKEPW